MRAIRFLVVGLTLILLFGCGRTPEETEATSTDAEDTILIGLSFDSLRVERWQKDRDIFIAEAEKLGAECIFQDANGDARKQNETLEVQQIVPLAEIRRVSTWGGEKYLQL